MSRRFSMKAINMKTFPFLLAVMCFLSACQKTDEVEIAPVKAVKILTISESTRANSRQISGTVKSANESALSFRVSGRVASVHAKTGDSVTQGQVLAKLESKEYELAVQSARAELASARSNLVEKEDAFKRQQNLKKKDFVAQASVDQAQSAYITAKSSVETAEAALENAENDLENTILKAPLWLGPSMHLMKCRQVALFLSCKVKARSRLKS